MMLRTVLFLSLLCATHANDLAKRAIRGLDGTFAYTVAATGSMLPSFDHTYVLLANDTPFRDLKVGDVILFWATHDGELKIVCHRIWARSSGGSIVLTKGDNNQEVDGWNIMERDYIGRVVGWVKRDIVPEIRIEPVNIVLEMGKK